MLSKLKKLKLNKIAIISISILISLALCFGFFYAALINQEKQKMEVSVLEISPYTEKLSIAGKEITQNYAVTTINGKKYINNLNTVKLLLKGTDENYSGNSLTASNIVVKVGGSVVTPKTKTLGSAQNITNGVQYELTLAGIPGNGVLTVEVDANTLTDKSQNKNILTKFDTQIIIDNAAPTLNSIKVTSPVAGMYKAGQNVTIVATFSENIQGSAPVLGLKFGSAVAKGVVGKGTISGNTITYTYTVTSGDNGLLGVNTFTGTALTDLVGNVWSAKVLDNTGNAITADTAAPSAPTITAKKADGTAYESGTWTNQNVIITASSTDNISGVSKIEYSYDKTTWKTDWGTTMTTSGLTSTINGTWASNYNTTIYVKATDKLGNESTISSIVLKQDKLGPTYTSVEIKNVSTTGYDVYVYGVKDVGSGVNRVQFPTWTDANGQDDIQSNWQSNTSAKGTLQSDGTTWLYRVNVTEHKNEYGLYNTHVYLYDNLGNQTMVATKGATVPGVNITYDNNYLENNLWTDSDDTSKWANAATSVTAKANTKDESVMNGYITEFTMGTGTAGGPYKTGHSKLTSGKQYTWSVYVKASSNKTLSIGQEQGGNKTVNVTTSWQRVTHTFTANDNQYIAFVFYVTSGSSWTAGDKLYVHSLEINEASNLNISTVQKGYGATLGTLNTPSRTGYTFQGWFTQPTDGTQISSATTTPASNTTYYAHWKINSYTVTYKSELIANNNFSNSTNGWRMNSFGTIDSSVKYNGENSTRIYTSSSGWDGISSSYNVTYKTNTKYKITIRAYKDSTSSYGDANKTLRVYLPEYKEDGTIVSYNHGINISSSNLTDKTWKEFSYTFTSNASGSRFGTLNIDFNATSGTSNIWIAKPEVEEIKEVAKMYNEKLGTLPTVSRTGYTFQGWFTDKVAGTQINTQTRVGTNSVTYYAHWATNTYTIAYNGNGATGGSTASSSHVFDTAKALTANGFTKTGYTFAGWATSANGSVVYSNNQSVVNLSSQNGATVTLYAKWNINKYYIDLNMTVDGTSYGSGYNNRIYIGLKVGGVDKGYIADYYTQHDYGTSWEIYGIKIDGTELTYSSKGTLGASNLDLRVTFYTVTFAVNNAQYGSVSPTSLIVWNGQSYSTNGLTLTLGDGRKVNASIKNASGYTTTFANWSSASGTVTSKGVTITANFNRAEIKATALTLNKNTASIVYGETTTIIGTLTPADVLNKNINWTTSNSAVCAISSATSTSGASITLTAKAVGTATITAVAADGSGKKAECAVTVTRAKTATAAAANKTYNGASQTGVTGSYVSWGGTTAGIDAGSYTATATPDGNHAWSDGTTAAKSITWTMSAKGVAVTWGTTTTFTYNGAAQGPTASAASGVTGETINVTRTTGTNAGSYTSTASISSVTGGRAKAGNYKLTGNTKAFTINRAATATAAAANKTYNGSSQTGVTGSYVSWGGTTAGIDAGSYTATATPDGNHAWSDGTTAAKSITWTMSAKGVAVTWGTTTTFTYNGAAQGPTASAASGVTGETINVTRTTGTNAGSYTSTASISSVTGGRAKAGNYTLTGNTKAFTINKANAVNPSLTAYTGTYDGAAHTIGVTGGSGGTIQYSTDNKTWTNTKPSRTDAGETTVYVRVTGDGNHNTTTAISAKITVNKRAITVKAADGSKTYDGAALTNAAATLTAGTLVSGQSLTATATGSITNVGSTANTVSSAVVKSGTTDVSGNYTITKTNGTLTVNKRTLTVKADAKSKTYGAGDPGLTYTYSNQVSGQTPKFSGALSRDAGENVGTYAIKQNTLALADNSPFLANNYTIAYTGANLTINAKNASTFTVTLSPTSYTYDGGAKTPTATVKDGNTTLTLNTHYTVTYSNNINAGTATATITGKGNYTGTKAVNFTINKRTLTVKADAKSKTYGAGDPGLTYTYSNQVSGQTPKFSGALSRDAGENVGTYAIKQNTLALADNSPFLANNYTIAYTGANLTINRAATATAAAANKTYNGASQTGVTGSYVSWGGTTAGIDAGSYTATATPDGNHAWSDGTTAAKSITWTMSAKGVAVTWGTTTTFTYNGAAQGPTASATSGVTGETINVTRTTGTNAGSYTSTASISSVTGGRAKAGNYKLTGNTKAFTINRAATATAAAANKTYNGSSQTGVTGSYVSWANSTTGIDAGSYTATATPDGNHAWSDGTTAAKNITWTMSAKGVAVTWGTTTTFTYNGAAQGPTASAASGVTGETINVTRTTGTNAGSYTSTASISSVTGGRAKAGNYTLTGNTKAFTINRAATATAAAANKTYNGSSQTGITGSYVSWGGTTAGIDAGSYTATATPDGNHAWSDGTTAAKNITWTMSAKGVAVTWGTTTTFTYNGAAQGPTASAASGVTGETINVTRTTGTNAGSYTSTASISSVTGGRAKAGNYKLTGNTKAFTINRAATATAAAANKTYNGSSQTGVTGSYVSWGGTTAGIDAGSYTATATPDGNHAWSDGTTAAKSITWTMSAKGVAVTWGTTTTFTYNGAAQGPTASAASGVTGETINVTRTTGTNAGSYTSTASISSVTGGRAKAGNYTLTGNTKAFTINRAATATAAAANKTYNGSSQTGITGSYVSWGGTTAGIDAGSYTATATPDGNHAWSDGTTAAKNITWTMSAKGVAVTWGTTTTFTYNGAAQGPTASAASGVTGETINVTRTTGTNAGSYTSTASISSVTGGRAKAGNYTLTGTTKAFTINKANLTLTFSANSGSVSYKNGTGSFTVTPSGYIGSETGTLNVSSGNSNYISVTSGNASTAKNNTAVTVGYQALQYTSSKINITVSIAATTNYNSVSKTYEVTITDTEAPILTISSNKTYAKSHTVTVLLQDGGSGIAAGTYNITCIEAPEGSQTPTTTSRSITVTSSGSKGEATTFTVSGTTGICKVTAYLSTEVKDVAGNSLAAGTSVTGEQYLDNTAPELSDFKYAISTSKPSSYSSASYNVKFDITEGHSGMAGYYDVEDLSTSLSSTDSRWKAHTDKTIDINMKYGDTKKIWLKDNAGNVSYKTFSLSAVAVSTETNCYVLYPTLQSAIGTASSNSTLRKWNSFWNSYIIKKC